MLAWRSVTTIVWAAVVISGWFWTQAGISARVVSTADVAPLLKPPDMTNTVLLSRLLGASALPQSGPGPNPADRFVLSGVIASRVGQGAALIAVDGKPAQPFSVGSVIAPGYVLMSVALREAMLGEGMNSPVRLLLTLPLPLSAQSSTALPTKASGVPNTAPPPVVSASGISGVSPLASPNVPEQTFEVPARADARRQLQQSLRREDQRKP